MKSLLWIPILLGTQVLAGCTNGPTAFMSPKHPYDYIYDDSSKTTLDVLKSKIQADMYIIETSKNDYYSSLPEQDQKRRLDRERIVETLMKYIDEFWRRYRSSFYGDNAIAKTSVEILAGGLSGISAITSGGAARILATLSSGTTAVGTSLEKNVLQNNAADLLLSQMEADRKAIGLRIDLGLSKDTSAYPLATALHDVDDYASAMSVPSALASLRAASGSALQKTKDSQTLKDQNEMAAAAEKAAK